MNPKMWLLLLFLSLGISFRVLGQSLGQYIQNDFVITGAGCSRGWSEFYRFKPADITSYQPMTGEYGKDKYHVYYKGKILPCIDPVYAKHVDIKTPEESYKRNNAQTLLISDGRYSYYESTPVTGLDTGDVCYYDLSGMQGNYFISARKVYYRGNILPLLNPDSLRICYEKKYGSNAINQSYIKDHKYVYFREEQIHAADASSFFCKSGVYQNYTFGNKNYYYNDSIWAHDKNMFYTASQPIKILPDWIAFSVWTDSLLTQNCTWTFISRYQTQDEKVTPPVDFYITAKDAKTWDKKRQEKSDLHHKTRLDFSYNFYTARDSIYDISVFRNGRELQKMMYNRNLEELDILPYTSYQISGDGFHLPVAVFDSVIQKSGKRINYKTARISNYQNWSDSIQLLQKHAGVITTDSIVGYKINDRQNTRFYDGTDNYGNDYKYRRQEGFIQLKVLRSDYENILHPDDEDFSTVYKRIETVIKLLYGTGSYLGSNNLTQNEIIDDQVYEILEIYCSENFAQKIKQKHIFRPWTPFLYWINWQEEEAKHQ